MLVGPKKCSALFTQHKDKSNPVLIVILKDLVQHSAEKDSVSNEFCYTEFLAYYRLGNKGLRISVRGIRWKSC